MNIYWNRLLITLAVTSSFFLSRSASAIDNDPLDSLVPTRLLNDASGEHIVYAVPCGATATGFFLSPFKNKVRIAAVVRRNEFICAGLPIIASTQVQELGLKKSTKLIEFPEKYWRRQIALSSMVDIREVSLGSSSKLQIIHESGCQKIKGLFMSRDTDRVTNVGVAEIQISSAAKDCPYHQEVMPIGFFNLKDTPAIVAINANPTEIEDLYRMRMASSPVQSIKALPSGGIAITYQLACNEKPVGVAVSGVPTRSADFDPRLAFSGKVGVVVAKFYNRGCPKDAPAATWEVIKVPFLKNLAKIETYEAGPELEELSVKTPTSYESSDPSRGMSVTYYGGCDDEFAALYVPSKQKSLQIGILSQRSDASCDQRVQSRTMFQPMFVRAQRPAKIYPLRINAF